MKNYSMMETRKLLAEKSHMEQLGCAGEVQLLEIMDELKRRRDEKPAILVREPRKAEIATGEQVGYVTYGKHAEAYIYPSTVVFKGHSGGEHLMTLSHKEVYQDQWLLGFYNGSEYLTNGIKARVMIELNKLNR